MLNTIMTGTMDLPTLLICLGTALILGLLTSVVFSIKTRISSSLFFTLIILPVTMCVITLMVNGNLGLAVSVAGGFSLVRFRSIAGNGKEVSAIFIVMAIGVITGMGYIGIAVLFFGIVALAAIALSLVGFGQGKNDKLLKVTLPDNYDYENLFDDTFKKFHVKSDVEKVKTTNLGSLIEVHYHLTVPSNLPTKNFLDQLRVKNANLEIQLASYVQERERL